MRKIFMASPYGHDDKAVVEKRFQLANECAAAMIKAGACVFSQVSMSHPINLCLGLDRKATGELWAPVDKVFMEAMDELVVLDVEGWDKSAGVKQEMAYFEGKGRRVSLWSEVRHEFNA